MSVTRFALNALQTQWAAQVQREYEGLSTARDLISFLRDDRYCNNLGYELVRYLQNRYGVMEGGRCRITVAGQTGTFRPCRTAFGASVPEEEYESYCKLLAALAAQNGMAAQFPAKTFRAYLKKTKNGLSRESCFQLSFAMGMDWDSACHFLEVMGQPPYQFRAPEECVYYYCQCSETMNDWATVCAILDAYHARTDMPDGPLPQAGQTQDLEWAVTLLAESADAMGSRQAQIDCMTDFLVKNASMMRGFSLSAHELFLRKLDSVKELLGVESDQEAAVAMWSPIWLQYSRKCREAGKEDNEKPGTAVSYDFLPFKNLVDLPKTLYEKPLWRARIRKLREQEIPVEKRDILFLCLMEWIWSGEECGGLENMQRFLRETNADLVDGGFSLIYPPNPYDRMILLSVCHVDPLDVLADIFEAATPEKEVLTHLTEEAKK